MTDEPQVLPEALASASSKMPSNIMGKVRHVVDVWRQRNIFPADTLAQIDARLAQGSSGAAPPSRAIPRELVWPVLPGVALTDSRPSWST